MSNSNGSRYFDLILGAVLGGLLGSASCIVLPMFVNPVIGALFGAAFGWVLNPSREDR